MKKSILLLILMLLPSLSLIAQKLYPYQDGSKWGYKNSDNEVVVQPQYESASEFIDGYGIVSKNRSGKAKYGVIDAAGNVTIPMEYDYVDLCNEGYAALYSGKIENGFYKKGTWVLAGLDGTIVSDEYVTLGPVVDGVAWANTKDLKVRRRVRTMPIVNKKGKEIGQENVYRISKTFIMNDLFEIHTDKKPDYSGDWVLVNTDGEEISEHFEMVGSFSGGLAWVYKNGRYGFVNTSGKVVIPIIYRSVEGSPNAKTAALRFNSESLQVRWVGNEKGELAWIDENGKIVIDFIKTDGKVSIHHKLDNEIWDF